MSLPTAVETDELANHLAELDAPGTNLLRDLLDAPPVVSNDTPLSAGYTSEESADLTVTTPSEEQLYGDMTFLQRSNTRELEEEVADLCGGDDLTLLSPKQQQVFAGKMIKGKTSRYRGVTQTSKTSWGAKYSAKRITNTCKTPEEAALAYDAYIKSNCPEKYPKFANFCQRCGHFVNPLSLPQFKNECTCDAASDNGSTEAESPLPRSETDGEEEAEDFPMQQPQAGADLRCSSLSINSLKLSFLEEEGNPLIDESMLQQFGNPVAPEQGVVKRDSLTIADMEAFAMDGGLDRAVRDVDRLSGSNSLTLKPLFPHSDYPGYNPMAGGMAQLSPMTDVNPDELQRLPEYFDMMPGAGAVVQQPDGTYKKIHSLDFQPESNYQKIHSLDIEEQQQQPGGQVAKMHSLDFEQSVEAAQYPTYATPMELDELVSNFMPCPTEASPPQVSGYPTMVEILTPFLEMYWRNDRKNIQCFPYCPEHGDYKRVRLEELTHRCKGVCRAPVKIRVTIPSALPVSPSDVLFLARCNCSFSQSQTFAGHPQLNAVDIAKLQEVSALGSVEKCEMLASGGGYQLEVTFFPDVWKFEFDLPKKRRHGNGDAADADGWNADFLYFFEVDLFHSTDKQIFHRLGRSESAKFKIGNTRTLLRQRAKMNGDADQDRVVATLPEKKKMKIFQNRENRDSTLTDGDGEVELPAGLKHIGVSGSISEESDSSFEEDARYAVNRTDVPQVQQPQQTVYGKMRTPKTSAATAQPLVEPSVERSDASAHSTTALFTYSLLSIPMSLLMALAGFVLLILFIPAPGAIVRMVDALSDMDLRHANSSTNALDRRYVLNRLEAPEGDGKKKPSYLSNGAVWGRFAYFIVGKWVVSLVVFFPALLCTIAGVLLFPIRPVSRSCLHAANACVLVSREYTRKTTGKLYERQEVGAGFIV